jgi:putative transposase
LQKHHTESQLSLRRQCELLGVSRSSFYYEPRSTNDQQLIDTILKIWTEDQSKGYRMITADLRTYYQYLVNGKRVRRIMHKLGIKGIIPKRNLSKNKKPLYRYPYLLENLVINQANMAWSIDISYLKLPSGYMYLIAIIDVYSRCILGYEISNTLDTEPNIRCLERCISKYGAPVIMNTDQGVQYTSHDWINKLKEHNILISMDGKGRWADNITIERFWRTIKYCSIFMQGVETVKDLKSEVKRFVKYYNERRLHSSLNYRPPMSVYQQSIAANDAQYFRLYCDIAAYKVQKEKDKLKYEKRITQKYAA